MRHLPYREGTWFAVPLSDGEYALGIVARIGQRGVTLGYFFGPRRRVLPTLEEIEGLSPGDAAFVGIFGDLGLIKGRWPIIGRDAAWNPRRWAMPAFGRIEEATGRAFRVEYDDVNLPRVRREVSATREEVERLPKEGVAGYGFIEAKLTRLLSERS